MNQLTDEDELMHYGMPKRSGRYPYGSGDDPYQHSGDFLSRIEELKKTGLSDTEIAKSMGLSTTDFRAQRSLANADRRAYELATAKSLKRKGFSNVEIAEKLGYPSESSVRSLFNETSETRMNLAKNTAERLKKEIAEKGMIDVGAGAEIELGVSKEKLTQALKLLKEEGYPVYGRGIAQVTNPGKQTSLKVVCPPGTESKDVYNHMEDIHTVTPYQSKNITDVEDPNHPATFVYPRSMDSSRLKIRYAEEGGIEKDGIVEIRRNVEDLSLGNSTYAQVRILVDDKKYVKGVAVYSDDMPDGVDVIFNTNKKQGTAKEDVLKNIKDDPDNPFGSLIKANGQSYYIDKDGNKQLSLINKRAEEGDWDDWKNALPSQFLAKQNISLINKQLNLAAADKLEEYDEICSYTNPTVKKVLLKSFADDCDAAAVHLQAAALPRQKYKLIIPITSLKDDEVYAPDYNNGEKVALIRYPHGGTFEIPVLTVNNKHAQAKNMLGNAKDAVGINSKVAERLSGADFDGDTVMVIPTGGKIKITSTPSLEGLKGFDPKTSYGYSEVKTDKNGDKHYYRNGGEFKVIKNTQTEMGKISNLITDMTLKGANTDELARAVRHSMVVIDAEKHKLDYKQSYVDNGIASLKKSYQGNTDENGRYHEGASTLLSRAKSEVSVLKRQGSPIIDKETGKVSYKTADDLTYIDKKTGKTITKTQKSTKMAETDDARTLSSGTREEEAYATYANKMKALANQARKEMVTTGKIKYDASAKAVYQNEVSSLLAKLNVALKNAPRERAAQLAANIEVKAKTQDNPGMTKAEIKKASQQALTKARLAVGAAREPVKIEPKEWAAIQAGAISETKLYQILSNTNIDDVKQYAMPRTTTSLTQGKIARLKSMSASGYTTAQIAKSLGISSSTVSNYLN